MQTDLQDKGFSSLQNRSSLSLPLWRCFSLRIAAALGGMLLLVILITDFWAYKIISERHIEQVQSRILTVVTAIAESLDVGAIEAAASRIPASQSPESIHLELLAKFERIAQIDRDVFSIYIFLPTDDRNTLQFFIDYSEGKMGEIGQLYDATDLPVMLQGFSRPIVEDRPYEDEFGASLSAYAPLISESGKKIGLVGVDVMVSHLEHIQRELLITMGWLTLFVLALVVSLTMLISRWVRVPLSQVVEASLRIAEGEFDAASNIQRHDEFGWLGKQIDRMAIALKDRELIRDTFGRYMSKKLASSLLEGGQVPNLGGEERVVTVLFADLKCYSTLSEYLSPAQVLKVLNEYFGAMNEVIDAHRGCVLEFLGDGMLVVFGTPIYDAEHAEQAVKCALEMQAMLAQLNVVWEASDVARLWQAHGIDAIEMRIGVHTGPVVAGNMGSETRMKYGVIGDTVNVASRLERLNRDLGTGVLISEDVKSGLSVELSQQLRGCGAFAVKGRQRQVETFTITAQHQSDEILAGEQLESSLG